MPAHGSDPDVLQTEFPSHPADPLPRTAPSRVSIIGAAARPRNGTFGTVGTGAQASRLGAFGGRIDELQRCFAFAQR